MRVRNLQSGFFITLLVLTTVAFLWLIRAFLEPVLWAAVLAVVFRPLYVWLRGRIGEKREGLATFLTVLTILVVVIAPVVGLAIAVVNEGQHLYSQATAGAVNVEGIVHQVEDAVPAAQRFLADLGVDAGRLQEQISGAAATAGQYVAARALTYTQNVLGLLVMFFIMLYLLFFFVKDGERIVDAMIRAFPLNDEQERRLLNRFAAVSRATIKGSIIVGAVQGALGGIAFAVLGIQGAIFWGVVMVVASLIPTFGTALIWAPAALVLALTGEVGKALALVFVGTVVIGMVDNFLRPVLVGREAQVPDWIVLLTSLGGIAVFGLSGLIIGPVVASLFLTVWDLFGEEYAYADAAEAPTDVVIVNAPGAEVVEATAGDDVTVKGAGVTVTPAEDGGVEVRPSEAAAGGANGAGPPEGVGGAAPKARP